MMDLDSTLAQKLSWALGRLDKIAADLGLHVESDGLAPCLEDADGNIVARIEFDASTGTHKATVAS